MTSNNDALGFTLIEIAVAVAILGIGLITLIGLQTRMLDTYYNERSRIRAAFFAQYLMATLDAHGDVPDTGSIEQDLRDALKEYGYFDSDSDSVTLPKQKLDGWRYRRQVSSINLPLLEDAMRRIDLTILWGDREDDSFSLIYFVANTAQTTQPTNPFLPNRANAGH